MIKINLLSPSDKENLKWEKMNSLAVRSILGICLCEALFAAAFLLSLGYLRSEEAAVAAQLGELKGQKEAQEMASMEDNLKSSAAQVDSIAAIEETRTSWSYLFENIASLVPPGAKLKSMTVTEEVPKEDKKAAAPSGKFQVAITGNAKTRDDLLQLEEGLKRSALFSDLSYNDANYVKAADIDFSYHFTVDGAKLLR